MYEVVLFGATGFTGRFAVEYLSSRYPTNDKNKKFAIAGRDQSKLKALSDEFPGMFDILIADASDPNSIDLMASQTRVVLNLAGPFAKYGSVVVQACVKHGTQYCDISGESFWNREMIDKFNQQATENNSLVVSFCAFYSVPFDLPVLALVKHIREKYQKGTKNVQTVVKMNGSFSGGTFLSFLNAFESKAAFNPENSHPYALNPRDDPEFPPGSKNLRKQDQDNFLPWYDSKKVEWRNFWIMNSTNSKVIRRSQRLYKKAGFDFGENFAYLTEGQAAKGFFNAVVNTLLLLAFVILASIPFTRNLLYKFGPKSGSGPSEEVRKNAKTTITFTALVDDKLSKKEVNAVLTGGDLGYTETAHIAVECALLLARKKDQLNAKGGVVTPAFAFGTKLLETLNEQTNIKFKIYE